MHLHPGFVAIAALLCLSTLACTTAPSSDEGFSFSSFTGDGDGDGDTTGDGDGDGDPGDGDGDTGNGTCGDGVVDDGEECDFGPANSDSSTCTTSCLIAECGD